MYGYPEFPTANMHDFDLHQLICLYGKLVSEYDGLVSDIATLKDDFKNYQSYVNNSIAPLVQSANMQYLTKLTMLENQVKAANTQFNNALAAEIANRKTADQNLYNMIINLQNTLTQWQTEYQDTLKEIQTITDGKIESVKLYLMGRDAYFYSLMLEATQDLQNQINEFPDESEPVINPLTGKPDTANGTIRDIWDYAIPWGGMTCEEFDNATYITCEYWNNTDVSCLDWYTQGKLILNWYYPYNHVFSPVTGQYVTVQTAIYQLAEMIKRGVTADMAGVTAQEYDTLNISAENYDALDIKAKTYDWDGKENL